MYLAKALRVSRETAGAGRMRGVGQIQPADRTRGIGRTPVHSEVEVRADLVTAAERRAVEERAIGALTSRVDRRPIVVRVVVRRVTIHAVAWESASAPAASRSIAAQAASGRAADSVPRLLTTSVVVAEDVTTDAAGRVTASTETAGGS